MLMLCICLGLSACTQQNTRNNAPLSTQAAQQLSADGRFAEAARAWLALAEAQPEQALEHRVRAADAWLADGQATAAKAALEPLRGLSGSTQVRVDMRRAEAALAEDRLQRAVALMTVAERDIPEQERLAFLKLRAQIAEANGDMLAAARDHHRRSLLQIGLEREQARAELFRSLSALPASQLQRLTQAYANDPDFGPWVELAGRVKTALLSGENLNSVVQRFQQRYAQHPAAGQISRSLVDQTRQRFRRPNQVAVLLPREGRFAIAGSTIRDGLINAFYQSQGERPVLRFYNTGDRPAMAVSAYRQAVEDGADMIVGPLDRAAVAQLQSLPERGIPVFALNEAEQTEAAENAEPTPPGSEKAAAKGLNQPAFGDNSGIGSGLSPLPMGATGALFVRATLSPEAEAMQAARLARQMGKRRALVLTAEDSWGDRMLMAFESAFAEQGGMVADVRYFRPDETNHDAPVQAILDLQRSQRRYQRVRRLVGESLSFEPTIRQDADVIFLAARAENARLLVPLLNFHRGGDLPILATAAVHDLARDSAEEDLEGVMFCDAPWVLDGSHKRLPEAFGSGGPGSRLFALGMDSYRLLPFLEWLASEPGERFPGATGDLSISPDGRLLRELACARFDNGQPLLLAVQERLGLAH
jgi:hypothetical protein